MEEYRKIRYNVNSKKMKQIKEMNKEKKSG